MAIGIIVASVFIPLILIFMVAHPRDKGLEKDGHHPEADREDHALKEALRVQDLAWAQTDWTLARAARTPRFYLLCFSSFCIWGVSHHILVTHQIAFALDLGFDRTYASDVISPGRDYLWPGLLGKPFIRKVGPGIHLHSRLAQFHLRSTRRFWPWKEPKTPGYSITTPSCSALGFGMCFPILASATTDLFQGAGGRRDHRRRVVQLCHGRRHGALAGRPAVRIERKLSYRFWGRSRSHRGGLRGPMAGSSAQGAPGAGQGQNVTLRCGRRSAAPQSVHGFFRGIIWGII